jgi:autotransporter translocation and assembly factor TamB
VVLAAALAAVLAAIILVLVIPPARNAAAFAAIDAALHARGFSLHANGLRITASRIVASGLEIDDRNGAPFFTAKTLDAQLDPAVWTARSDRRYGLISLDVVKPLLHVVRYADGSYNFTPLLGAPSTSLGPPPLPYHTSLSVRAGELDVTDPAAPSPIGRRFHVDDIAGSGRLDTGSRSTLSFTGDYVAGTGHAPLRLDVLEYDSQRFAQAIVHAGTIDAAAIVDALVPTKAFSIESAPISGLVLRAFSIDYDPAYGPDWQISATGELKSGSFRVLPLTTPINHIAGRIEFAGGELSSPQLLGSLEGAPVKINGGLRLLQGVQLALAVHSTQSLENLRHALAFATKLDVVGPIGIDLRIDGPPATLDIAGRYVAPAIVTYSGVPVSALAGTLFYNSGHLTFPVIAGVYDEGSVNAQGDVDLNASPITGSFVVLASIPSDRLPLAANVEPGGIASAFVAMNGPLEAIRGVGFAQVDGKDGGTFRTAFDAGPQRFAVGPGIIDDVHGGEFIASGAIDRTTPSRTIQGVIVARSASLHTIAASRSLPGVDEAAPVTLPEIDGSLDGTIVVRGEERSPDVAIHAVAQDLVIGGARLGRTFIDASGHGGQVHIAHASIDGPDARMQVAGDAVISPKLGSYAALLKGSGDADLAAIGGASGVRALRGDARGSFTAALAGGHWTVALDASSPDAAVGNVRVSSLDASIGGGGGSATDIYAGRLTTAGGVLSAMGPVPGANAGAPGDASAPGDLKVWSDSLDIGSIAPSGSGIKGGRTVGVATIGGTLSAPRIAGAASVYHAQIAGRALSGDLQLRYGGDRLVASGVRFGVGGGFVNVDGTVDKLGPDRPVSDATLDLAATMREGDLGALAGRYLPSNVRLSGTMAADLRVDGTVADPHAVGNVDADSGTLQGVAFEDLRGSIDASARSVQVNDGSIGIGTSQFSFGGSLSRTSAHVRASSADVDLADFNDFFNGYDTLEGHGSAQVAFESSRGGLTGSGNVDLAGASVLGFPLGTVAGNFSGERDRLLLNVRQNGETGNSDLRGTITFTESGRALPDFRTARYDIAGRVRGADLGRIMPIIGRENIGLTGDIDADGYLRGRLSNPAGRVTFALHDGHLDKIAIDSASGTIDTDGKSYSLRYASISLPFAQITGQGTVGPRKRIAATATIDATDLSRLAELGGRPGIASGSALVNVSVAGTLNAPRVTTNVVSGKGAALGVRFDRLTGKVSYQPGEVDIADAEVDLSRDRGVITIGGTLPLQLEPFGLGPKTRPINLRVAARSVDLSAFDGLTSRYAALTGTLDVNGAVTGTAGRPQLSGSAQLRDASITSPFETVPAENLNADVALDRDTLTISKVHADLGRGTLSGGGSVHIIPAVGLLNVAGIQYTSRLHLRGAQIDVPDWTAGTVTGDLQLNKSGTTPFASGDVTLDDGTIPFAAIYRLASGYGSGPAPESGPIPGVPELQPGHIVVYGGPVFGEGGPYVLGGPPSKKQVATGPKLPSVDLAVKASAGKNVRVHGGAIDLTAGGGVLIGGNLRAPTLAGEFSATRGQIGYFDTNFRLERGVVTFDPTEGLLPTLDVKATTNLNGAEITLTVTGRIDNLQTDLSSNPAMSRDDIVATLLHAPQVQSVISSTPGEAQTALYAEAQSYFNAQLTRSLLFPVESLLAQTINVEQISLIYDQQGRVNVEVRKLVTPTVYAIYRSSLNVPVTQTAGVAYSLRDYADLEILQTQSASGLQQATLNLRLTFH